MSEEESDDEGKGRRKAGKKKYYPFGTPSHLHHAFSEFAHIDVDSRSFAMELATSSDIKPEVVVEEKPKKRRPAPIIKKKVTDDESKDKDKDKDKEEEELQPCTKVACQQVVRALSDMEFKNQVERMDLEDAYEQHVHELRVAEQDIRQTESKLEKLTDIGNQLEMSANQLLVKVETLEKAKEELVGERNDINSKLMLLEVEKQKWNRKLEKAQKSLADARWKKKKAALEAAAEREGATNLGHSVISDGPIFQCDASVVSAADDVASTDYSRLAQKRVVDHSEQAPPLQTIPAAVQESFFKHPERLDKYARAHYKKHIQHSLQSWEAQSGSLLACSLRAAEGALAAHERRVQEESVQSQRRGQRGRMQATASLTSSSSPSLWSSVSGTSSLASSPLSLSSSPLSRSLSVVYSVQSVFEHATRTGLVPRPTGTTTLFPVHTQPPRCASPSSSSASLEGGVALSIGETSLDRDDALLDKLADQGVFLDPPRQRAVPRTHLDASFIRDTARASYGRRDAVGKIRVRTARDGQAAGREDDDHGSSPAVRRLPGGGGGGVGGAGKFSAHGGFDPRAVPRLQSQVLTTKHPGMTAFAHAATMSMTST